MRASNSVLNRLPAERGDRSGSSIGAAPNSRTTQSGQSRRLRCAQLVDRVHQLRASTVRQEGQNGRAAGRRIYLVETACRGALLVPVSPHFLKCACRSSEIALNGVTTLRGRRGRHFRKYALGIGKGAPIHSKNGSCEPTRNAATHNF